jgi:hypothetical protein
MTQALQLMTGDLLNRKVGDPKGRVRKMINDKMSAEQAVESIYLASLSRRPTDAERNESLSAIKSAKNLREGLEDLLWTMLNTREFQFNH